MKFLGPICVQVCQPKENSEGIREQLNKRDSEKNLGSWWTITKGLEKKRRKTQSNINERIAGIQV